jgi:succinyl-diaminopimelate desuccinylase
MEPTLASNQRGEARFFQDPFYVYSVRERARIRVMKSIVWILCLTASFYSCGTKKLMEIEVPKAFSKTQQTLDFDPKIIRPALLALPHLVDEDFPSYLARVRAALLAQQDPLFHSIGMSLPESATEDMSPLMMRLVPHLLGRWATGHQRNQRYQMLKRMISYPTVHSQIGSQRTGRQAAFAAVENDLQRMAASLGLEFEQVDHVAYGIHLRHPRDTPSDGGTSNAHPQIGILVHADVRDVNFKEWSVDPFTGVSQEDRVIGRGALNSKGALVALVYALASMRESEIAWPKDFSLIVGTDGELHGQSISLYEDKRGLPATRFMADGPFPVSIGEKGRIKLHIKAGKVIPSIATSFPAESQLVGLKGGEAASQVPTMASAWLLPLRDEDPSRLFESLRKASNDSTHSNTEVLLEESGQIRIDTLAQSFSASDPAQGDNAILNLLTFIQNNTALMRTPCTGLLHILERALGPNSDSPPFGITDTHPEFSDATFNLGILSMEKDRSCEAFLDIQWPPPRSVLETIQSVKQSVQLMAADPQLGPFELQVFGDGFPPYYIDPKGHLPSTLLEAFNTVFGEDSKPYTSSNGTVASTIGGAPNFGPQPYANGGIDRLGADEYILHTEFDALVETYTFALARLGL